MEKSPYLNNDNRLADVISAIQVMAVYKFYKLDFKGWSDRITGDEGKAEKWETIFIEHSEFFRLDSKREKASLTWRRSYPRNYNVDTGELIPFDQIVSGSNRISRAPLTNEDIGSLIETAINLHSRALQHRQDKRWWIPVLITAIGFIIGLVPYILDKVLK